MVFPDAQIIRPFRSGGGLDVTGLASGGEVEDYMVPIGGTPPTILLGTMPGKDPVLILPFSGNLECSLKVEVDWEPVPLPGRPGTYIMSTSTDRRRFYRFVPDP